MTPEELAGLIARLRAAPYRPMIRMDRGNGTTYEAPGIGYDLDADEQREAAADALTALSRELEEARELCAALRISESSLNRALADEVLRHQAGRAEIERLRVVAEALEVR